MKTILYILIAVLLFGTIATRYSNKPITKTSISIQAIDSNISSFSLSQSAKIISNRLHDFSTEKFNITINPGKNQIQVILTGKWDLKSVENLLIQKGKLEFYETYDHQGLTEYLKGDNHLLSLLTVEEEKNSPAKIGCISFDKVDKVNDYLKSLQPDQKCKFSWGQNSESSEQCLYALKLINGKSALLTGTDVESIKFNKDAASKTYYLDIKFKESAVELWSDATKRNLNNAIAIVLDNKVIYAPIVRTLINNGLCQITGDYTENQVRYLVAIGNNGELPVYFKLVK